MFLLGQAEGIYLTMGQFTPPVYDFEIGFYRALGIRWETGRRYRKLGVLKPDAKTVSGRPLFRADLATLEKAKAAIAAHRVIQTRAVLSPPHGNPERHMEIPGGEARGLTGECCDRIPL
jgi:hypothetical protein